MPTPHFPRADCAFVRSADGGLQSSDSCLLTASEAPRLLAACGGPVQFAVLLLGRALSKTGLASQSAIARAAGMNRRDCRRTLADLEQRGMVRRAAVGHRGAVHYEFSTGYQHAELTWAPAPTSASDNPSTCAPAPTSHYPLTPEFKERKEELTQRTAAPDLLTSVVQELISVPDWLGKCSEEKKLRKTAALVRSYCERWPLSTIRLWIKISESENLEEKPLSRAAWIYAMLREYGAKRKPVGANGHPLRWQEAVLRGDLEQAETWLSRRKGYRRDEEAAKRKKAERAATSAMQRLGAEVPEVAEALAAFKERSAAL